MISSPPSAIKAVIDIPYVMEACVPPDGARVAIRGRWIGWVTDILPSSRIAIWQSLQPQLGRHSLNRLRSLSGKLRLAPCTHHDYPIPHPIYFCMVLQA